jgi:hypothetical protein
MIPKVVAIGIIASVAGALLSEMGCRTKWVFSVISVIVLLLGLCGELSSVFSELLTLTDSSGMEDAVKSALKVVGIGYVYGISSEVCEELGEKRIAQILTTFSRVEIFLVILPYVKEIADMGVRLLK